MTNPSGLQQILWDDWINCYWVEVLSQYEPIVFLKVFKFKHENDKKPDLKGETIINEQYIRGEDGFVYKQTMPTRGDVVLVPLYQFDKEIF